MTHTFEYHPIETAPPKPGVQIMAFWGDCWESSWWDGEAWTMSRWHSPSAQPTLWAEIKDMAPVPSPVLSDQLDSTPLTVEEKP